MGQSVPKAKFLMFFSKMGVSHGGIYPVYPQVNSGHFDGTCWEHEVKKTSGTWGAQHLPKIRIGLVIKMCYVGAFPQRAAGSHPNGCELQTLGGSEVPGTATGQDSCLTTLMAQLTVIVITPITNVRNCFYINIYI